MHSKNKRAMDKGERAHVDKVKSGPCAVCGEGDYSEAHEITQGNWYTSIALCEHCHRGPQGIHGDKTLWRIFKVDENDALNETLRRIYG